MTNPWLEIPLADYEGHMSLPGIEQAQLLADELESAARLFGPKSVAVIGCAGGNGFGRLAETGVQRVVGIDVNPVYIDACRRRYSERLPGLELVVADIQRPIVDCRPVDLVYAALIFEYVECGPTFQSLRSLCNPIGKLVVVAQAAGQDQTNVSPSPYKTSRSKVPEGCSTRPRRPISNISVQGTSSMGLGKHSPL
jgi:SAM-dependent methyltransferase